MRWDAEREWGMRKVGCCFLNQLVKLPQARRYEISWKVTISTGNKMHQHVILEKPVCARAAILKKQI